MKCPHCLVAFHVQWTHWFHPQTGGGYRPEADDADAHWQIRSAECPTCRRLIVQLCYRRLTGGDPEYVLVRPKAPARLPLPPEVFEAAEALAADYQEAALVLADSEKASAALSRRCLQNLLRQKAGVKPSHLDDEIQQVIDSKQLPSHLANAIDSVRAVGNFATHPIKSKHTGEVLDVEPGEAEWLLDTLEGLFDFYFVQPTRTQKQRDALNQKLADAGKPPLKQTSQ